MGEFAEENELISVAMQIILHAGETPESIISVKNDGTKAVC